MTLLERDRCLADLAGWLADAACRSGCIALVGGEAGVGKTALLQELAIRHPARRQLWGVCDALFMPRALAPLHDIASQTGGKLLAALTSEASREEIFTAALEEIGREAGTLAVFEDVHWADETTLDLLKFLGRRIHRTRALLVVTYRDHEMTSRHPLRFVIGDLPRASTRRMTLEPLSEPAVEELARRAERPAAGLHRITGGNPFLLTEALAAEVGAVPATVRDAVLARVARLAPKARELAELVCIVPGKTESWLIGEAVGPDETDLERCLTLGVVRDDDGALAFRHELARRALEESLFPARTRALHACVLAILTSRAGVPAARLARHAAGARDAEAVLRYAPLAAREAACTGAHREAVTHYEAALGHARDLAPGERARLHEQLATECAAAGEYARAMEACHAALALWRAAGERLREGDALRALSGLSSLSGDYGAASRYGIDAVALLESLPPGPELALAYCNRAELDVQAHEANAAIGLARRALELAQACACARTASRALVALGVARLTAGDGTGETADEAAREAAREASDDAADETAPGAAGEAAGWADLGRALEIALAGSYWTEAARAYASLGALAVSRRNYARASQRLEEGLALCGKHGLGSLEPPLLAQRGHMRFERGDWQRASLDAQAVLRHPATSVVTRATALLTLAHLKVRRGDADASVCLDEALALCRARPQVGLDGALAAIRAEAAWLGGDRAAVLREAQPAYELLRLRRDPLLKGALAVWLARASALQERPRDVAEPYACEIAGDWRGAARAWQALGCPYEHASVLGWHGSEDEQRQALDRLERMGAAPAAHALRRQLRARGVRRVPRGSRPSTRSNALGLTRRESQILALLSDGLRNSAIAKRLFVSTKTVDHHVSAILAKLEVTSRVQAALLARAQPPGSGVALR